MQLGVMHVFAWKYQFLLLHTLRVTMTHGTSKTLLSSLPITNGGKLGLKPKKKVLSTCSQKSGLASATMRYG